MTELKPGNTALLSTQLRTNLGVWLSWLRDLGGEYEVLAVEKSTKKHTSDEPLPRYELDPQKYYRRPDGSIRRISQKGLEIARKLGI